MENKNTFKNKFKKILAVLSCLLLLTGCDYMSEYPSWSLTDFVDKINNAITRSNLDNLQELNQAYAESYTEYIKDIVGMADNTYEFIAQIGTTLTTIISVASILAAVLIVVKYAIGVFKDNMYEQNRDMAPDMMTRIKKIITAIILAFALPYICMTSFMAATYLGTTVANFGKAESTEVSAIYKEMKELKISYSTYCSAGQKNFESLPANTEVRISYIPSSNAWRDDDEKYFNKSTIDSFNNKWCPGWNNSKQENRPNNVYEALFAEGKQYDAVSPYKYGVSNTDKMSNFFLMALMAGAAFFAQYCVAKRVVELIFLIASGWWYIGNSVSETHQERSIQMLFKKLLTICLSQFFMIYEWGIYYSVIGSRIGGNFILGIAFLAVMMKTPQVIEEMVADTGTSSQAMMLTKAAAKRVGLAK